jgi:aspartate carbamoyltransferase catalytic subunit
VITLFYEPSTRTRTSFEIAAKRLSADTINISSSTSSSTKGESLKDTARNLESMRPDAIVIRHGMPGAPHMLARILDSCIINGGDGSHEHPTQALLDLFTIRDKKGRIEGLKVVIVGDIAHSRVARSNIFSLRNFGNDVICCGPPTMIPPYIETLGVKVEYDLKRAVRNADVIMMLRIQKERGGTTYIPSTKEYSTLYGRGEITSERPERRDHHASGPMNRGIESPTRTRRPFFSDPGPVENGVACGWPSFISSRSEALRP